MLLHHQPQIISCSLICSHQYHISSMDLFSPLFPWCYSVKCPHTPQHQSLYYSKSNNANDDAQFFILSILYVFCVVHNMFLYVHMHHLSQNSPPCIQTKLRETIFYRNTSVSLVSPWEGANINPLLHHDRFQSIINRAASQVASSTTFTCRNSERGMQNANANDASPMHHAILSLSLSMTYDIFTTCQKPIVGVNQILSVLMRARRTKHLQLLVWRYNDKWKCK